MKNPQTTPQSPSPDALVAIAARAIRDSDPLAPLLATQAVSAKLQAGMTDAEMSALCAQLNMPPQFTRKFQCMALGAACMAHVTGVSMGQSAFEAAQAFLRDNPESLSDDEFFRRLDVVLAAMRRSACGAHGAP